MWFDFYDRHGRPYAYADDGVHIYKYSGKPIAYIAGQSVYSYPGRHVGFFEDGMILDHRGDAILFTKLASGEPARPAKQFRPVKPIKLARPAKGPQAARPMRPARTGKWSSREPADLFE